MSEMFLLRLEIGVVRMQRRRSLFHQSPLIDSHNILCLFHDTRAPVAEISAEVNKKCPATAWDGRPWRSQSRKFSMDVGIQLLI